MTDKDDRRFCLREVQINDLHLFEKFRGHYSVEINFSTNRPHGKALLAMLESATYHAKLQSSNAVKAKYDGKLEWSLASNGNVMIYATSLRRPAFYKPDNTEAREPEKLFHEDCWCDVIVTLWLNQRGIVRIQLQGLRFREDAPRRSRGFHKS